MNCRLLQRLSLIHIFCTGLSDLNLRSRQIEALFAKICRENTLTGPELELLPAEGYALAFQEFHNSLPKTAVTGAEDYLSYLLHYHFPRGLCYSFKKDVYKRQPLSCAAYPTASAANIFR